MEKILQVASIVLILMCSLTCSIAQQQRLYIANDDHTDYMWTADEATYRRSFLKMLDFYVDLNEKSARLPVPYQNRWNCDGSYWLWEYERNKTPEQFRRLMNQVKAGKITVPYNTLIACYGAMPTEAVLRGMYYAGSLERRFKLRFNLALAMENQGLPLGLASLWAGSGVNYSWRGVCGCATRFDIKGLGNRPHEIYWYKGLDSSRVLMKWYSLSRNNNRSLGGYAELRQIDTTLRACAARFNSPGYPYHIMGAFGRGWDDLETLDDQLPRLAKTHTTPTRQLIVSNEIDFFRDFEKTYGARLPTESVSYGNEWDTYSASMAEVSAQVRRRVEKLRAAEAMATLVSLTNNRFARDLDSSRQTAWTALGLFWEHDWTADGPVSRTARANWQRKIAGQVATYVDSLYNRSQRTLGGLIQNDQRERRFYAFNPLGWTRTDVCDYPYPDAAPMKVIDLTTNQEVPSQRVILEGKVFLRILASAVPSVGYKVFAIRTGASAITDSPVTALANVLENQRFRITVTNQGVITSLIDKANRNRECVAQVNGRYMNDLGAGDDSTGTLVVENAGPVSITLRATGRKPLPHTSRITLYRDVPRIDIRNQITQNFGNSPTWTFSYRLPLAEVWHEEIGAVIKAKLQTEGGHYSPVSARYDWLTLNHFADITTSTFGLTLSNADCAFMKVGNSTDSTLDMKPAQLSVLAGGQVDGPGLGIPNQGGDSLFTQRFALGTHQTFDASTSMRFALEHQNPLVAGTVTGGDTYSAKSYSLLTVSDPSVLLWSVKPAEEGIGQGLIARLWNLTGLAKTATIRTKPKLKLAQQTTHVETNLLKVPLTNNELAVDMRPQALQTYRLHPAIIKK